MTYIKAAPARERALDAIERREQAGEPISREAIVIEAGVSRGVADSALAAYKTKLGSVREQSEELGLGHYFERLKEVEDLLNSPRWAVMPPAHYKQILSRLHPDRARAGDEAEAAEAFALFNSYKPKLVDLSSEKDEKDRLKRIEARGNPLPRTVEEMLARKTMKRR